jgi:heme A synthase
VPGYQKLALITTVATYLLIVVGGVVRVTGSGLGCPDWPTCHGRLIPPLESAALIEFTHRLVGALVSPLILATTAGAWLQRRNQHSIVVPATALPLLLAIQIILGAVVVWLELPGMVVLVHLGFALLILGGLTWIAVVSGHTTSTGADGAAGSRRLLRLAMGAAGGVFALILVGALVRAQGASWACSGFPGCNGAWLPFGTSRLIDLHLTHRLLAYAVTLHLIVVAIRAQSLPGIQSGLRRLAAAPAILALIQVAIGAVAVSGGVTPLVQTLHLSVASAIWVAIVALLGGTYR